MVNDGVIESNHIKPQTYPFLNQHAPHVNNAAILANLGVARKENICPFYRKNNVPSIGLNAPNQ